MKSVEQSKEIKFSDGDLSLTVEINFIGEWIVVYADNGESMSIDEAHRLARLYSAAVIYADIEIQTQKRMREKING